MAQVDFYILSDDSGLDPLRYGARLIDKVYHLGMSLYAQLPDQASAEVFSEGLWAFSDDSFLAHDLGNADTGARIAVDWQAPLRRDYQVLLNLAGTVPEFHGQFERIAEIVPASTEARDQCRRNYRFYQEQGYALKTHTIGSPTR